MNQQTLAFGRTNYILLAASMAVIVLGFCLMAGGASDTEHYNPAMFNAMRIRVAPALCFIGFVAMIYAIVRKPKSEASEAGAAQQ